MKILVVNKFYWGKGGSERVMFDLSRGYQARGHEVAPFAMASDRNDPTAWSRHFAPESDWDGVGPLAKLGLAGRVIWSPAAARSLQGVLREFRPDVAHVHNFHHQLSPSILAELARAGVPVVHTLHDYKVVCPNYLLYTEGAVCERCGGGRFAAAVRHRCVRDSRAASFVAAVESAWHRARRTVESGVATFVSPSRFLAAKVTELGFRGGPVRVVPNGVEASRFEPATVPGERFLYAGRLSREKGIATLLAAVARQPAVRLDVAGDGPEAAAARASAESTAPGRVRFLGHLEPRELGERMRAARAVVVPSEWYENAPMAVLEAAACGVPVVGARIGGIPELVRDADTGLLHRPGDADDLGEKLARLAREPETAARLGRSARRLVEDELSLDRQIRTMLGILGEVVPSASR